MGKAETALTKRILDWLNSLEGCYAIKRHTGWMGNKGQPDITGCYIGQHFELEVKIGSRDPEPMQLECITRWKRAHAVVAVVRSLGGVKNLFKELGWYDGK